jgi:excisionase family DNA binding protein
MTMATAEPKKLLTQSEAAQRLGIGAGTLTVWRSTRRYGLPYVKVGRAVRYESEAVEAFIRARTIGSPTVATC